MNSPGISLRLSVTDGCQFHCIYCRSIRETPHVVARKLTLDELCTIIRSIHSEFGISKIRFTGGEPLLRKDLATLIRKCSKMGIEDLALTTNGQQLAEVAEPLKQAGLRRVNVSLDSLDAGTFSTITWGGDLSKSLSGIDSALRNGLHPVKLNMVVMRGINDHEIGDMLGYAGQTGCQIRFLELMPIGVAAASFDRYFVSSREIYDGLTARYTLHPLDPIIGSTSRNFLVESVSGPVICGFISPTSDPFCRGCRRLRLTDNGLLFGCLARCRSIDLHSALAAVSSGDPGPLTIAINDALAMKAQQHDLSRQQAMARIGG
jgi:GTP 3',8-cyclase